ncbi:putative RNA-directed DNA polymerase, eukaryota, reverse transcriptase zinc-binding domain protein [Tanacetum coccineum]
MSALLLCSGRFLALVLQLQIGYGYRQARMPLVESIMDAPCEKAPGPDGFSFKFVKKYWEVLQHDIFKSVMEFCNHGKLPLGCNASFISLIPKVVGKLISSEQSAFIKGRRILDGPLMVWSGTNRSFGFGSRWRNWIRECLSSAKLSILINGSRTEEIPMYRGLRQGDPLSHLLFILAMEGLHLSIQKAMEDKRISGVFVGVKKLNISHLFYADDVVFLSEWNAKEVDVGVDMENVSNMARASGCAVGSCPFSYLGVNMGANMACKSNWDNVLQCFHNRLSNWKVKMLSIRGD